MFGNPSMKFNLMIRFEDRVRDIKRTSCEIRERGNLFPRVERLNLSANGQNRKHDKTVGNFNCRYRLRWMLGFDLIFKLLT